MIGRAIPPLLLLLAAACSRRADPVGTSSSTSRPVVELPPLPAATDRAYTAMGVCNRIAASGVGKRCRLGEGGASGALFDLGSSGTGMVMLTRDEAHYRKALNEMNFGTWTLGTSDKARAIVIWKGGSEVQDMQIRAVLLEIDAE